MGPLLAVREVSKWFGGLRALHAVSLDLAAGEILGVIGPNGAGKSTLFNIIAGQIRADAGQVSFAGGALAGASPEAIARQGLVKTFQTSRPFGSMSFVENVMVGALARVPSLRAARAVAERCLDEVGLAEKRDTPARGASTGQRKRLEIARALATGPRLLLLDEPFGGVDVGAIDALIALLKRIRDGGVTLLVIEHNLDAVHRLVDRLIAMNLGETLAEGAPQAVTADPRVVRAYLGGENGDA
jgi:branched-chain amino acid transport system ATP-binding protein